MAFTYFFRDGRTLDLIVNDVLPTLTGYQYIRIWDAGCAHGPEPYSLAILLREHMSRFLFRNVRIYATDLDAANWFGPTITEGVYPEPELRRIPPAIRERYFREAGAGRYRIDDPIRSCVSFIQHDLLSLEPIRTGFSLIVCKNVLLHFNAAQRQRVIRMFHAALRDGGFLVTEQTQKLPEGTRHLFEQVTREGQVFTKRGAPAPECVRA